MNRQQLDDDRRRALQRGPRGQKIEARLRAPPEGMLNISMMVPRCCSSSLASTAASTWDRNKEPIRNTISAPITNSSLRFQLT